MGDSVLFGSQARGAPLGDVAICGAGQMLEHPHRADCNVMHVGQPKEFGPLFRGHAGNMLQSAVDIIPLLNSLKIIASSAEEQGR
jgi:hypothetical protein